MDDKKQKRSRRRFVTRTVEREEKVKVSTEYPVERYRVLAAAVSDGTLPSFAAIVRAALDASYDRIIKLSSKAGA